MKPFDLAFLKLNHEYGLDNMSYNTLKKIDYSKMWDRFLTLLVIARNGILDQRKNKA
jgi:hypothetical protein